MATQSMGYDNPAYLARSPLEVVTAAATLTGASTAGLKHIAWTNFLLKSVIMKPSTAGTSNDIVNLLNISGTTTTTTALGTFGSGATAFQSLPVPGTAQLQLQGDTFWVQKGTDATVAYNGAIEQLVQPLANVTT
jgi:hypothetical protein